MVQASADVPEDLLTLLYDPQTAGGLLISVASTDASRLVSELNKAGVTGVIVGEVVGKRAPRIEIVRD
jgi:selenide,water dikinase